MAKVRLLGGKPLMVGGKVAMSDDCCCSTTGACCAGPFCHELSASDCANISGIFYPHRHCVDNCPCGTNIQVDFTWQFTLVVSPIIVGCTINFSDSGTAATQFFCYSSTEGWIAGTSKSYLRADDWGDPCHGAGTSLVTTSPVVFTVLETFSGPNWHITGAFNMTSLSCSDGFCGGSGASNKISANIPQDHPEGSYTFSDIITDPDFIITWQIDAVIVRLN